MNNGAEGLKDKENKQLIHMIWDAYGGESWKGISWKESERLNAFILDLNACVAEQIRVQLETADDAEKPRLERKVPASARLS